MSIVEPLPEHIKTATHVAGCLAIFLASHRALGHWRAVQSLTPPPDTAEALEQGRKSPSSSPSSSSSSMTEGEKRSITQPQGSAELGFGVRARGSGSGTSVDAGRKHEGESRRASTTTADIAHTATAGSVVDEAEVDEALGLANSHGHGHGTNGAPDGINANIDLDANPNTNATTVDSTQSNAPDNSARKTRMPLMQRFFVALLLFFSIGSLLSVFYTLKWIGPGVKIIITAKECALGVFLCTTWFKESMPFILPRPLHLRIQHAKLDTSKPPHKQKPYKLAQDYPEAWTAAAAAGAKIKMPVVYRESTRYAIGAAVATCMMLNAGTGRFEYIPFLAAAVTLNWMKPEWCRKMRWRVALVGTLVAFIFTVGALVAYLPKSEKDKSKPKAGEPGYDDAIPVWLFPVMMAPMLGVQYGLAGTLISAYLRYEDTFRNPVSRFRPAGTSAPLESFTTRNHPRTAALILALFTSFRALAWWQSSLPADDQSWRALPMMESVLGPAVVLAVIVGMGVASGELKKWWMFEEQECPTELVSDEVDKNVDGEFYTDEKRPLVG